MLKPEQKCLHQVHHPAVGAAVKNKNPFPRCTIMKDFKSVLFVYFITGFSPSMIPTGVLTVGVFASLLAEEAVCCHSFLWSMKNNLQPLIIVVKLSYYFVTFFEIYFPRTALR